MYPWRLLTCLVFHTLMNLPCASLSAEFLSTYHIDCNEKSSPLHQLCHRRNSEDTNNNYNAFTNLHNENVMFFDKCHRFNFFEARP